MTKHISVYLSQVGQNCTCLMSVHPKHFQVDDEDFYQPLQMCRLISAIAGHTCNLVANAVPWLIITKTCLFKYNENFTSKN